MAEWQTGGLWYEIAVTLARRAWLAVMWRTYTAALNPHEQFAGGVLRDTGALRAALAHRSAGGVRTWWGLL